MYIHKNIDYFPVSRKVTKKLASYLTIIENAPRNFKYLHRA